MPLVAFARREGSGKYITLYILRYSSLLTAPYSASLQNFCRAALPWYRICSSISHSFYALIILGALSLDSCELHSPQKISVEGFQSSHLPQVAGDFVGGGMSNHTAPALSSAAGFLSGLGRVTLQPGASVSPFWQIGKAAQSQLGETLSETLMNTAISNRKWIPIYH